MIRVSSAISSDFARTFRTTLVFSRDPVKEFVDFATRSSKYFKKFICIAHNAKAFGAQFILKYIIEKSGITEEPRVILNGTKIIVTSRHVVTSRAHTHMRPWGRGPGRKTVRGGGRKKQLAHWLPLRTTIPLSPSFPPGPSSRGKDHGFIYEGRSKSPCKVTADGTTGAYQG